MAAVQYGFRFCFHREASNSERLELACFSRRRGRMQKRSTRSVGSGKGGFQAAEETEYDEERDASLIEATGRRR